MLLKKSCNVVGRWHIRVGRSNNVEEQCNAGKRHGKTKVKRLIESSNEDFDVRSEEGTDFDGKSDKFKVKFKMFKKFLNIFV